MSKDTTDHDTVADTDNDKFMTVKETCDFLSVSRSALFKWRVEGTGPRVYEIPNMRSKHGTASIRYRKSDLIAFMTGKGIVA